MRYPAAAEAFDRLLCIMDDLREKCPWDKKQTLDTLRHLTIEETYELSDAILSKDMAEIRKEVGDVMLHLVFYSKIGSETGDFDATSMLHGICEKLISRHPHIYGDVVAETEEEVKANWEALKLKEGNKSVLSGVPGSLPSLVKAMRIQEKARGAGFDWEEKEQVWEKVEEELGEFKETFVGKDLSAAQKEEAEGEMGDLIFSLVNFARFIDINPDQAVERTNRKFIYRFQHLERRAAEMGKNLQDMTLTEMDILWNEAKVTLPGS
ncbi:MAG: nucleoside triphosphate pyrophosphohydrolase [Cytophagaceae bacterium]|nr:nucleoside triphosphate pyrophosphohydrolase [Cytophagaceae bacterium]MBP6093661.1 nucleoside triphosphate pyrophosphohydrolase [Cytophagaceae bacterium]